MSRSIRFTPEPVKTINFSAIGAAYMGVGTATAKPIRMLFIQNLTDVILMFSFDGLNDHFPLPTTGYIILDIAANKIRDDGFFLAENQRIFVKELISPATSGDVYVTTFYGSDD